MHCNVNIATIILLCRQLRHNVNTKTQQNIQSRMDKKNSLKTKTKINKYQTQITSL